MALSAQQIIEMGMRGVQRALTESNYVNTINLADRISLDFVWYPGATAVATSLIDILLPVTATNPAPREIPYVWARTGMANISQNMTYGRITLPLAPGATGTLTVLDTQWQITRAAVGVTISAVGGVLGIQQRLNALGYHLRQPGAVAPGNDSTNGAITERAVLSFQIDYRRPAGAPAASPAGPLRVRGELASNPNIQANLDFYAHAAAGATANPSATDSAQMQAALVAIVGS